jgi:hypothetical protein
MNHSQRKFIPWMLAFCLALTVSISSELVAQSTSSGASSTTSQPADPTRPTAAPSTPVPSASSGTMAAPKPTTKSSGAPSSSDIAAAKASGKVWVNTESRVYHKSGRWYGKTKNGKFMTESEAKAAGYKEAHR